ncbi:DUF4974 domain-containing protein [Hymenobacter perfusus]|uniref:DUF4974 domain-containing protein n=2 Tax=Hymenobacter perfusus TaxID=1236770 RepID=A0A428K4B3_9BACT|nr:DUF4974 domain-containing protein [Hymenobacter perfusus]
MAASPDQNAFLRYVNGMSSPLEAASVRNWLSEPTNQLLARVWMEEHWNTLDTPATLPLPEPDYEQLLGSLHQRLGFSEPAATEPAEDLAQPRRWRYWAAAAATAGLLTAGGLWWQTQPPVSSRNYTTAYGEMRRLHLPDGSQVTLNGNSSIRYAVNVPDGQPREVWLNGEAYFSVRHLPSHQRFVVHTNGGFNVEVLGTKFTVFRRREESRVVLLSGKVRVDFTDTTHPDVVMKPGELVETQGPKANTVVYKPVQTDTYAAWKDAKLVLDNTSITDLATRLHDTYGLDVTIATPSLKERRMTGTVPVRDLDLLLRALEETFQLKADRRGNDLILSDSTTR